ncbi:hypothetical protein Ddye_014782 [Dipteronia dyeriana]|uniref:F-box domain-containing protein n=1 Tax=Dipteronia dyeriana TaxID=168575 RepID=A0AAD9U4B5_9ROSI|nr:hypothetical protein Ddye_014782 [Dipteronia dyeriana]
MEGLSHTGKMKKIDRLSYLPEHIIYHILSLMDTKDAVRTCVLSKNWRYSWTNIHSLYFCCGSFPSWIAFQGFVTHVLHHCKDLNLVKLEFYCFDGGLDQSLDSNAIIGTLTSAVFEYAISHRFEEIETDVVDNFPPTLFECQALKRLKFDQPTKILKELTSFATLTTLQLNWVEIDLGNDTLSVNLRISDLHHNGLIMINAPRLKFFNLNRTYDLFLWMIKCSSLEEGEFVFYDNTADSETIVVELSEAMLALPMVPGCHLNGLRSMLKEIVEKDPIVSTDFEITWLVGVAPNF